MKQEDCCCAVADYFFFFVFFLGLFALFFALHTKTVLLDTFPPTLSKEKEKDDSYVKLPWKLGLQKSRLA